MITSTVLRLARALGLFAVSRWLTRRRLRILCYHGAWIGPPPHYGDRLFIGEQTFRRRMALLAEGGYRVLPLGEAVARLRRGDSRPRDVVITIDDAWHGTERLMLPVLAERGYPATLYVPTRHVDSGEPVYPVLSAYLLARAEALGRAAEVAALVPGEGLDAGLDDRLLDWLEGLLDATARRSALRRVGAAIGVDVDALVDSGAFSLMTPQALQRAMAAGIDVQLHTHNHTMHDMSEARVRRELEDNRAALARLLGRDPAALRHFCYPSGDHRPVVYPVLGACGIETATTTEFGLASRRDPVMALPRILDGESMSDLEFEARLSGFWSLLAGVRQAGARLTARRRSRDREGAPLTTG